MIFLKVRDNIRDSDVLINPRNISYIWGLTTTQGETTNINICNNKIVEISIPLLRFANFFNRILGDSTSKGIKEITKDGIKEIWE